MRANIPPRGTVCSRCGAREPASLLRWRCSCGGPLDLEPTPRFDRATVDDGERSLWRYRAQIGVAERTGVGWRDVSMREGGTPLVAISPGDRRLLAKVDYLMPTLSFKDRGAAVLITHAAAMGAAEVIADSSGNAGTAIAAYAARAGIGCTVYVRSATSLGKLSQAERYGARVVRVPGTREDAARAAHAALSTASNSPTMYASHVYNPWFLEGTKTLAYEICEQLDWTLPDRVVLPVGNGTLVLGAAIGFRELVAAGIAPRLPRIIAVQAELCAPIATAFARGATDVSDAVDVITSDTAAEGIAIASPARGAQILAAVRESKGAVVTVTEGEIAAATLRLAEQGFDVEPTAAATCAAAFRLDETDASREAEPGITVTVLCGAGLKSAH